MAIPNKNKRDRLICLCNAVPQSVVEKAIREGAHSLSRIFDETMAGVGACGGSCQPCLKNMLETYQQTGQFPENPRLVANRRKLPK